MKKFITASLIISMLFGVTASAAWEFDEKRIASGEYVYLHMGMVSTYVSRYGMPTMDHYYFVEEWEYEHNPDYIHQVYPDSEEYKLLPENKGYFNIYRIDNNEFVAAVKDGYGEKAVLLTAKGIIGEAFYTDIKLNLNGAIMPCYAVDGYAAIKAEDLGNYGFDVNWSEEDRMLYITRNPEYYDILDKTYPESGIAGTHFSDVYGTDINVNFNGKRVNSYSINGEMLIVPELSLISDGISFQYSEEDRMLYMHVDGLEQK